MPVPIHRNGYQSDADGYGSPLAMTPVQLTTNATNTATSATQVTGLTTGAITYTKVNGNPRGTYWIRVTLSADSVSNSGANDVVLTLWDGVVGSGTQVASSTGTAQSGAKSSVDVNWFVSVLPDSVHTFNVGMHGSGAGTNTLVAGTTAPCTLSAERL